jgi:hypothetical protein
MPSRESADSAAMRARLIAATAVLVPLALAGAADARGTYQEGRLTYSVSGSYVATATDTTSCDAPFQATEKVSFSSGRGLAKYQGDVGKTPFFGARGEHGAKLKLTVTRAATPPAGCQPTGAPDCGTHTLEGYVSSEFEGPFRAGRPLDLHVRMGGAKYELGFKSPYKSCGVDAFGPFSGDVLNPPTGAGFDAQAKALHYPRSKGFWARKRRTLSGTARTKGLVFHMKMKLVRTTTKSKPDPRP